MARINNVNKQQTVSNPNPQSVRWPAEWVQAPNLTPKAPDTIQKWEDFNESWGANSKLWDAFNKFSDFQWKVAWHLLVDPITWWQETQEKVKAGSQYLNQNKQEQTAWWFNYSLNSNPSVAEQGQYNSLVGSGAVAWMPQGVSRLVEQPQTVEGTGMRVGTPLRVQIANEAKAMEGETPAEPTAETPAQSPAVSTWSNWGYVWGGTTTNQRQLKNADVNFSQYWDDSSAPNQATAWGQNDKYTWEFTRNSNIWYDPNITTADLDPNYLFWMDAQWANTDSAGYIARRNDMIASALYNEWRTSKQDVIDFLSSQPGWMNSTEADRANTIESIWKRIGGMVNENEIKDAAVADLNKFTWVSSDPTVNAMEADLNKDNTSVIYWKVWTDEDGSVKTLEDENSVYRVMNESRIQQYKQINSMDSQAIAAAIIGNAISEDGQQMRDLQQYNPDKYEYVMQAIKQIRWQQNINSIANWTTDFSTNIWNNSKSEIESFANNNATSSTSAADILSSVNSTLASNEAAKTAQETMDTIEKDMAKLKNRLKNLKSEANSLFKWDVPQYIVNAYMSNRTAEIQNEMSMLEDRYNAAYSRYQSEWEKVKWEKEFDLKKEELDIKKSNAAWDKYMDEQWLALKYAEATWDASSLNRNLMRTERNNNPTAMTTDVARSLWLVEWIDYTVWDPFQSGSWTLYTAKLLWDPIETTIKALDTAASTGRWAFYTSGWKQRWTHTAMSDAKWLWLSNEEKKQVVLDMLKREWGNIDRMSGYGGWSNSSSGTWVSTGVSNGVFTRKDGTQFNVDNSVLFNSLSDTDKNTVLWLLNLSIDPATLQTRYWYSKWQAQKLLNAAIDINPEWTDWDKKAAQAAYQAWNKDVQQQWKSKNWTAISTAFEVIDLADKIWNWKWKDWNSMINVMRDKLSDEEFIELNSNIYLLASEYAWALKGTASPTNQDIAEAKQIIASNFSSWGMKTAAESIIRALYNKNANEASNYYQVVLTKPDMLVTPRVADRMANELWLDMTIYGDYKWGWWNIVWQSNSNLSNDDMIYNIFSY